MNNYKNFLLLTALAVLAACASDDGNPVDLGPGSGAVGIGGSTARFTIAGDHLYVVTNSQLQLVNVADARNPTFNATINLGQGIETIYPYKNHLFIGGQFGMQIYNINDPANPQFVANYTHQQSCDPVIANDRYAYVTLRDGASCGGDPENLLLTIDLANISNPLEVSRINMINPRGLAFFRGDLYVGEGTHGLKKFSLNNPAVPELDTFYTQIAANDMIGLSQTMLITRDNGIFQYGLASDTLLLFSPIQ